MTSISVVCLLYAKRWMCNQSQVIFDRQSRRMTKEQSRRLRHALAIANQYLGAALSEPVTELLISRAETLSIIERRNGKNLDLRIYGPVLTLREMRCIDQGESPGSLCRVFFFR